MHPVEDEDAPSRSQPESAMRGCLLTFVTRYKISGSPETGVSYAGARLAITIMWSLANVMRAMSENA